MKIKKKKSPTVAAPKKARSLEAGPIQIAVYDNASPIPVREVSCPNYQECLNIAACLNWLSFSCEDCTREIAPHLRWRARIERRRDPICQALMPPPMIEVTEGGRQNSPEKHCTDNKVIPIGSSSHKRPSHSFVDRRNALDILIHPCKISNIASPSDENNSCLEKNARSRKE